MSAFRAVIGDHGKHELLHTSRHGAGQSPTGSAFLRVRLTAGMLFQGGIGRVPTPVENPFGPKVLPRYVV